MSSNNSSTLLEERLLNNNEIKEIDEVRNDVMKEINDLSVDICIKNNYKSVLLELKEKNKQFELKDYIQCIVYKKIECLKIIYDFKNYYYNDVLMKKSITFGYLKLVKYLYNIGVQIPSDGLLISILNDDFVIKNWIFINTVQFPVLALDISKLLKKEHEINDLINYEIKSLLIKKELLIDSDKLNDLILRYLTIYENFIPNINILEPIWNKIEVFIINYYYKNNKIHLLKDLFLNNKISLNCIHSLLEFMLYDIDDNILEKYSEMLDDGYFKHYIKDINFFYINNIPNEIYENITKAKNICINLSMCNECINGKSLIFTDWKDVFAEDENYIIYKTIDNYCFILQNLLKAWETELNSFNYIICPNYPSNPYNKELFSPKEIYQILIHSTVYQIEIPLIIKIFVKNPTFLVLSYEKFTANKDNKSIGNEFIKKIF